MTKKKQTTDQGIRFCPYKESPQLSILDPTTKKTMAAQYRFKAKCVFLTYPQCPLAKEDALRALRAKLGEEDGTHYLIGQEKHQDGNTHLHVYVEREKTIDTLNPRYFDIEVYHPNIEAPRDRTAVKKYVTKEDKEPLVWPSEWNWEEKRKGKWAQAAPLLLAGQSAKALLQSMPDFVLGNLKKVQEAVAFVANIKRQEEIPPLEAFLTWVPPGDITSTWCDATRTVWNVLRDNLMNKAFGRKQLYLHGPTGIGKSTFLQHLAACLATYFIPTTEDFYDLWDDELYTLSVMEEFKSQKTIQWLNQWLDGGVLNVKKKGSQALKKNPVPTVVLSNFDINGSDVYPNMQEKVSLMTLRRRFHSVEVDKKTMRQLTSILRLFLTSCGKALPVLPEEPEPELALAPPNPQEPQQRLLGSILRNGETVNPLWRGEALH